MRTTSSAEYLVGEIKRHKRGAMIALLIIALAMLGIVYALNRTTGNKTAPLSQPETATAAEIGSLAVLPFVNVGADP